MNIAIVEVEDGQLTTTVARADRRGIAVSACHRGAVGDGNEALQQVVRELASNLPAEVRGVHVLLGDRRAQHFLLQVPRLEPEDLQALVLREAMRQCNAKAHAEVMVCARTLRRLPGGRLQLAVTALLRAVWEPLERAFAAANLRVLSLHTVEEGLAAVAKAAAVARPAVLDYGHGRARFLVCHGDAPAQVRRFLVAGVDAAAPVDAAVLGAQLAMEVPRTIDFLKEQGHPVPELLLVGPRTQLGEPDLELIRAEIARCEPANLTWQLPAGQEVPGLAVYGRLRQLATGERRQSLLAGASLQLPAARAPWFLAALAAGWALVAVGWAGGAQRELLQHQRAERLLAAERDRLQAAAAALVPAAPAGETVAEQRLTAALRSRRPVSRLLAELNNAAPPSCHLRRVEFLPDDTVVVEGYVAEPSRREAMAVLRAFATALRGLGYLAGQGDAGVSDEDGRPGRVRFKFQRKWRTS